MLLLRRSPSLLLAPLLACASPDAPPPDRAMPTPVAAPGPSAERLALRFAWPDGFAARVRGTETTEIGSPAAQETQRSDLDYRIRVERSAGTARIRYEDFAFPDRDGGALVRLAAVPGLEALAAALRPSFEVDADGRFTGMPELEDDVAAINRELSRLAVQGEALPAGAPELPTRFSAELFRRHAPAEWFPLVEMWSGREVEPGGRYALDLVTRMPLLDGAPIRMKGELRVSERVACEGETGAPRCVELVLETREDPLDLLPLLGRTAAQSPDGSPAVTVAAIELRETVRLVTEPETLRPLRLETQRRARLSLRLPDGRLRTDTLDRGTDLVFHRES